MTYYKLYCGDCLEVMSKIEDKSIDMILCDLPYGTIACKWDVIIPFEPLWKEYERLIKDHGAIVLTGSEPFSSLLRLSNLNLYHYDWIWDKKSHSNPFHAKTQPLKRHENISIFYKNRPTYNPQKYWNGDIRKDIGKNGSKLRESFSGNKDTYKRCKNGWAYPHSIISISRNGISGTNKKRTKDSLHPTQKPVKLFEYLIKTYTNPGDLVLDNCAGSGTTGVACFNLGRDCIMIEQEQEYCKIIRKRMKENEKRNEILKNKKTLFDY